MRSGHLSAVGLAALVSAAGMVSGFVGVNDRCSLPTPYPPPGAAAGTAHNSDMEQGFSGGVAAGWTSFRDAGFEVPLHFAGMDRSLDGNWSQKLVLPQPAYKDQAAGIFQQIWVVPGAVYTANVQVFLQPPPHQSVSGEDLAAALGLDPFGEAGGKGGGMLWSAEAVVPYRWVNLQVSARAVLPVMTVSLKAVRKLPQHGNDARIWFDGFTLDGPVPTGTPPGPEPEPADPQTLMPRTLGGNLLDNGGFEEPFTNGVSAGWNRWITAGTGTWRQSLRVGKVGGGRYDCGSLADLARLNPKTILLYGGTPSATQANEAGGNGVYGDSTTLAEKYPHLENTLIIGRPAIDANWDTYKTDPAFYGRQLADQLWIKQQQFPRIDAWQGLNEPDTSADWQAALAFEKAFTDRAHELGMKVCVLNLSTGSPGNYWQMVDEAFRPSCRDLLAVADYLGHHCYGGPNDELMLINQSRDDACSFSLRPRRFKDMYDRRGWRFPPVIATEGSTWGGWHGRWRAETIANDLTTMGAYMNANRWWCGYTNFVAGGSCGWAGFEILGEGNIARDVGAWNAANPADAADGLYAQMFGAGKVHPRTLGELVPAGQFTGGINRRIAGLTSGEGYLASAWIKYEFRGRQPAQLRFHLGIDSTGQTTNGNAPTIDWGPDQIAERASTHEIYTRVWRTFQAAGPGASLWLKAEHPLADPAFMFYVDGVEIRQLDDNPTTPIIELSAAQVDVTVPAGVKVPNTSFSLRNSGVGTLPYTIAESAGWLSVGPVEGTSMGEIDTATLSFDTTGLPGGTYQAVISVAGPASNSPQSLLVTLTVTTVKPDFDRDGDVDGADFATMQQCLTGPGVSTSDSACRSADLDGDGDIDQIDFGLFQHCVSGAGVPATANCLP